MTLFDGRADGHEWPAPVSEQHVNSNEGTAGWAEREAPHEFNDLTSDDVLDVADRLAERILYFASDEHLSPVQRFSNSEANSGPVQRRQARRGSEHSARSLGKTHHLSDLLRVTVRLTRYRDRRKGGRRPCCRRSLFSLEQLGHRTLQDRRRGGQARAPPSATVPSPWLSPLTSILPDRLAQALVVRPGLSSLSGQLCRLGTPFLLSQPPTPSLWRSIFPRQGPEPARTRLELPSSSPPADDAAAAAADLLTIPWLANPPGSSCAGAAQLARLAG